MSEKKNGKMMKERSSRRRVLHVSRVAFGRDATLLHELNANRFIPVEPRRLIHFNNSPISLFLPPQHLQSTHLKYGRDQQGPLIATYPLKQAGATRVTFPPNGS